MTKPAFIVRPSRLVAAVLLLAAAPALAEQLSFDHREVPALKQVLDSGDAAMIDYNAANPRYITDVIAVRGRSARDWDEALVIIARTPTAKVATVQDWLEELRADAHRRCDTELSVIAQDASSLTFERHAERCPGNYPRNAIYRVVGGKNSLFLLAVLSRDDLAAERRGQWLALLRSAHLE